MAPHSNNLAWKIAWTEEPGGRSPWGCKESDTTEQLHFLSFFFFSFFSFFFINYFIFKLYKIVLVLLFHFQFVTKERDIHKGMYTLLIMHDFLFVPIGEK